MKGRDGHPAELLSSEVDRQHSLKQRQHCRHSALAPRRAAVRLAAPGEPNNPEVTMC